MFCLIRLIDEAGRRTFQVNEWVGLFFRCFAGSESFCVSSCSCYLISAFLTVSPMYDSWQEHTPSQITHDGWRFLLFGLNKCLTFLVIHIMQISYRWKHQTFSWNVLRILYFLDSMVYPLIQLSLEHQRNQRGWCSRHFHQIFLESH